MVPALQEKGAAQMGLGRKQELRPPAQSSTTPFSFRPPPGPSKLLPLSWPLPCLPGAEVSSPHPRLRSRLGAELGCFASGVLVTGSSGHRGLPVLPCTPWLWKEALSEGCHQILDRQFPMERKSKQSLVSESCPLDKGRTSCPQRPSSLVPPTSSRVPKELSTQGLDSMPSIPAASVPQGHRSSWGSCYRTEAVVRGLPRTQEVAPTQPSPLLGSYILRKVLGSQQLSHGTQDT